MSAFQPLTVPSAIVADVAAFARMLIAATRVRQMYSAEHPASATALNRLRNAMSILPRHSDLVIGVTPSTLMVNGENLQADQRIAEAAELLHDHDILRLRFPAPVTQPVLSDFLRLLMFDVDVVRARGGPARMWEDFGHPSIVIDQVDYDALLTHRGLFGRSGSPSAPAGHARPTGREDTEPVARDAIWETLVRSMSSGKAPRGLSVQQRLIEIAGSATAIESLAAEAIHVDDDGQEGMIAAQAATILTTFQRLVRAVEAQAPDDIPETLRNLAEAASHLDPQLVMRAIGESAESGVGADVTAAMGRCFDDDQVAHMLAKSLAAEGTATGRMAAALNTLAPDAARRERVLRLARTHQTPSVSEDLSGVDAAWQSLQCMLGGPGASAANTAEYSTSLDESDARSYQLSLTTPAQMDGWIQTVGSDAVRTLSATLLLDLFRLEERPENISETADDLATLAEDLLMSADTNQVEQVVTGLAEVASGPPSRHAFAAQRALELIAGSRSMRETSLALADFDQAQVAWFERLCAALGAPALNALVGMLATAPEDEGRRHIERVVAGFGDAAIPPLAPMIEAPNWLAARAAIRVCGRIGSQAAIKLLDGLLRGGDARKAPEAVMALARISDATAQRALAAALRTGSAARRLLIADGLAASREPRVEPLLASMLTDLRPVGSGHHLTLRILAGLRHVGTDQSVPAIVQTMQVRSWFRMPRANRLKRAATGALASINTPAAVAALDDAARAGDVLLKRHARAARRTRGLA